MQSSIEQTTESLSIAEMVRILDVASEVRRKQELLDEQWNVESARTELRERLRATQATTGENLTDEQIDTAINWFYDRLHRFKRPKPGIGLALAHIYVRRGEILKWMSCAIVVAAAVWWFFGSG